MGGSSGHRDVKRHHAACCDSDVQVRRLERHAEPADESGIEQGECPGLASLLADREVEHEGAGSRVFARGEKLGDCDLCRESALHVARTAPVDKAVGDCAAERRERPACWIVHRHGVHVPVQHDGVVLVTSAADAGSDARTAGLRPDAFHLAARLTEAALDHGGERCFAMLAVDARDLDELRRELGKTVAPEERRGCHFTDDRFSHRLVHRPIFLNGRRRGGGGGTFVRASMRR